MKNNLIPFTFENHQVRVVTDEQGAPWFNAKDVCVALDMGNPYQAIRSHVDTEDLQKLEVLTAGGLQATNHVNESGLYALILGSTKEAAKRFKRWVTHEVLPSIRKTGAYTAPGSQPATDDYPPKARALAEQLGITLHSKSVLQSALMVIADHEESIRILRETLKTMESYSTLSYDPAQLGMALPPTIKPTPTTDHDEAKLTARILKYLDKHELVSAAVLKNRLRANCPASTIEAILIRLMSEGRVARIAGDNIRGPQVYKYCPR